MRTLTPEEFKKLYGVEGLKSVQNVGKTQPPQTEGFLSRAKNVISTAGQEVANKITTPTDGSISGNIRAGTEATATAFNVIPKLGYEALPKVARTGLSKLGELISSGVQSGANKISDIPQLQEFVTKYPEATKTLENILGTASAAGQIAGDIALADQGTKALQAGADLTKKALTNISKEGKVVLDKLTSKIPDLKGQQPSVIMNRVARLKPTDATKFERIAGKTQGEYLTETGNFGAPDKILSNEASKFVTSKNTVDIELAKLPGTFKDGAVTDALKGLLQKARSVSSDNVKSPYLGQVESLIKKYNKEGLTMGEINMVKRLYEKNVKLGYNKMMNADKVEQATNIDNSLRNWQVNQAQELGFNNIAELNKQTQISKFLIDKLGDQVVGQNGLNGIGLTDWIVLGGGNPQAVAGFLTKKFFSSKAVQAKIAEYLNKGKNVNGIIKADVGMSKVKQLGSPTSEFRTQRGSSAAIKVPPKGSRTEIIR